MGVDVFMLEILRIRQASQVLGRPWRAASISSSSHLATQLEITNVTCHSDIESLNAPELFIQCVVGKLGSREPMMGSGDKVK
jgi:hypothetical protein